MKKLSIKVENLWKEYNVYNKNGSSSYSLKSLLNSSLKYLARGGSKRTKNTFFALQSVTFEISHGESIGLIGRNGAGKSTLLKILSRITRPSQGKVTLYEKVNSLLEIGTGFNTELSGRDNIFLNGSFLGMKNDEIKQQLSNIIDFSEIGNFIDTPVKYYSSGMFVRLAFSVAVHLTPELLLLDEVLSVGDAGFQQKSKVKMLEMLKSGATIVLVSHSEDSIREICDRVIWLDQGKIRLDGPAELVLQKYKEFIEQNY